jgi:feruloyl esterase
VDGVAAESNRNRADAVPKQRETLMKRFQLATAVLLVAGFANAATFSEADCSAAKLGSEIPASAIGEPVSAVTLNAPVWNGSYCAVEGAIAPVDKTGATPAIRFRVLLPASWNQRAVQLGGGGMNGRIPDLTIAPNIATGAKLPERGYVTYGSDSGHDANPREVGWALSDEAIRNLGFMQLKKTHDAAMVLVQRMYGAKPLHSYFLGTSQGGREGLTVAQRYPADYDGVVANVPIVGFSTLMLAPELIRIKEKSLGAWVTPAKVNAIRGEFIRQCDKLDGLTDGVINNYRACRALFASRAVNPWASKRCPGNVDPDPKDTSGAACLTDGQIETLRLVYAPYPYATPLANGVKSFGMWTPNTDPSGSGLILARRFRGQEGAGSDAPTHAHLGVLGVTGFLMKDPTANPLDYVEGGSLDGRRQQLSDWLDSTNPDLTKFADRGGKLIVTIGTNDTLASPGAQLDYYESLTNRMGAAKLERFARLFVLPQTNHGLMGSNYGADGDGKSIPVAPIPNTYDRFSMLIDWVENHKAPDHPIVTAGERSLPLCAYPTYPKYVSGPALNATSYTCATERAPR